MLLDVWDTFARNFASKNFQKSPNLVKLVTPNSNLSEEIDLNLGIVRIRQDARDDAALSGQYGKTDFAVTQFYCKITARFWYMIWDWTSNFLLPIWGSQNATYVADANMYCFELT